MTRAYRVALYRVALFRGALMVAVAATALASAPLTANAQRLDRRPARAGDRAQGRDGLERQFRERLAEVVRTRLGLDDAQMARLAQVNDRFERERMALLRQERQTRMELRSEVLAGDSANQPKVADLLDAALRIQRQRLDLTEREQRELGAFMTPVQRAMYFGIQDEMRRRMEEMRRQGRPGVPGARVPPGRRPPPP